jgi:hypothetical protein
MARSLKERTSVERQEGHLHDHRSASLCAIAIFNNKPYACVCAIRCLKYDYLMKVDNRLYVCERCRGSEIAINHVNSEPSIVFRSRS